MPKSPKLQWFMVGACIYVVLCVVGFLFLFVGEGLLEPGASLSVGRFLFLLLVVAPIAVVAYGVLEASIELGFTTAVKSIVRRFRDTKL